MIGFGSTSPTSSSTARTCNCLICIVASSSFSPLLFAVVLLHPPVLLSNYSSTSSPVALMFGARYVIAARAYRRRVSTLSVTASRGTDLRSLRVGSRGVRIQRGGRIIWVKLSALAFFPTLRLFAVETTCEVVVVVEKSLAVLTARLA
jgi:hypothetical protein